MKTIPTLILLAALGAGAWLYAQDRTLTNAIAPVAAPPPPAAVVMPPPGLAPAEAPGAVALTNAGSAIPGAELSPAVPGDTNAVSMPPEIASTNAPSPTVILPNGEVGLRINFRGVPLELVLNYLSDAAGFIIVLDTQVRGKVDMWSNTPLTKDEAINLLNSVLNKNGYAAIRNERTLTIVSKDEAKTKDIPVRLGGDPANIPRNDEIVTQIIPIRTVTAAQVLKNLEPLVSLTTTMTANDAGNSIIITDTQANIRRVAEIIKGIDTGAEEETVVRAFSLKFADPVEMATLLMAAFPDDSKSGSGQSSVRFGGGRGGRGGSSGGGPGGMFGAMFGGGDTGSGGNQRIKKRSGVLATADSRTASVIVTAGKEMMEQVAALVEQLDANTAKKQKVYFYSLDNADAQQVQQVLSDMFQRNSTSQNSSRNSQNQNNALNNRSMQNQQNSRSGGSTSGFGSTRGGGGGGGGGF
jgi:general secretion pathway protein D